MKYDLSALEKLGKKWVRYIREEARKDAQKSTFVPRSKEFYQSFSYAVEPGGMVVIYSTWEWLEIITEGTRGRYKMAWLTQERGVNVVPLTQRDGTVVLRRTPLTIGKAWVHPKIAKHTFINRAYERAVGELIDEVMEKALESK
jgi:hypothetical protein